MLSLVAPSPQEWVQSWWQTHLSLHRHSHRREWSAKILTISILQPHFKYRRTSVSSKQRTTWTRAWHSLIFDRNLLPSPCPSAAPYFFVNQSYTWDHVNRPWQDLQYRRTLLSQGQPSLSVKSQLTAPSAHQEHSRYRNWALWCKTENSKPEIFKLIVLKRQIQSAYLCWTILNQCVEECTFPNVWESCSSTHTQLVDQKVLMTYLPCPFSTPSRRAERRGLSVEILPANLVSTSGGCALCWLTYLIYFHTSKRVSKDAPWAA
jgi:hypothetical protein